MLSRLTLKISYKYKEKLTYQISSVMHGILLEQISYEYGEILHKNGVKPFSQHLTDMTENSFIWIITTMTKKAKEEIIDKLIQKDKLYMEHKELELIIENKKEESIAYDDFIKKYYFNEQRRYINLKFLTPTAFKSQGQYVFIPSVRHIFQSLMNKYDAFSLDSVIGCEEVLEHFEKYTYIYRYQLKSVQFSLEGIKVPAFIGNITLKINGPQQMVNLAKMLVEFGAYSGVGIKATLGMGAIEIQERVSK